MNLLKSLFIFASPAWLIFIVVLGVLKWLDSTSMLLSLGLVLSAIPLLLFLFYILVFKKLARTTRHLFIVSVSSFVGLVLVMFDNTKQTIDILLALSGFIITLLYIYWYSNNARNFDNELKNKNTLPKFTVKDLQGNEVSSECFHGNKSLIFFYRGNWCPLCMAQIDEVTANYKKFEENNIDVIFIAPQSSKNTKDLASKHNLSFSFYADENNKAAKKLGILHEYGLPMGFQVLGYESDSVYPTVIALDDKGVIIYSDQTSNYRVRPEPEELLKVFSV